MSAELKPCPFCGDKRVAIHYEHDPDGFGKFSMVRCHACGAQSQGVFASTGNDCPLHYEEVRNAWNRRATPAPGAPAEPTEAMVLAMVRRMFSERNYAAPWEDVMRLAYMDAIAAAPGAPGQEAAAVQAVAQETDRDWSKAQDWKGMDGATAFLLINRHSDGWGDVGAMMNAWLAANAAPSGAGEKTS